MIITLEGRREPDQIILTDFLGVNVTALLNSCFTGLNQNAKITIISTMEAKKFSIVCRRFQHAMELDLSSFASVKTFAENVQRQFKEIHCLVIFYKTHSRPNGFFGVANAHGHSPSQQEVSSIQSLIVT